MLRRLYPDQPESFAFTPANQAWAEAQVTKYPEGRQASAIIPLLWRAQEQEGWLSRAAIEHVAEMLDLAHIRALEVATFYFMFQLQPVGSVAHIQICGTTSCMICGAEDLVAVCREKIAARPHELSADGTFSWEEVECLGACANAPMAQIGKDYYEDLTAERLGEILDELAAGKVPVPGPQNGRYASEPLEGLTSLEGYEETGHTKYNASVQRATDLGDTIKRIDGTEEPLVTPWLGEGAAPAAKPAQAEPVAGKTAATAAAKPAQTEPAAEEPAAATAARAAPVAQTAGLVQPSKPLPGQAELAAKKGTWRYGAPERAAGPSVSGGAPTDEPAEKPAGLEAPRDGPADDLKKIKGVGPGLEKTLNGLGIHTYAQIAAWGPAEIAWVDARLKFKGRIERDDWVGQAARLASG
ncbi:MAG: NADH-quinone oxidoreductase subunit E [Rhodobacter sp.]|nr:NADH-quinone oxidoreductase subunit E [Rhodobacter sp.]